MPILPCAPSAAPASAEKRNRQRRAAGRRQDERIEANSAATPGRGFDCHLATRTSVPVTTAELCLLEQWLGDELAAILDMPTAVRQASPDEP